MLEIRSLSGRQVTYVSVSANKISSFPYAGFGDDRGHERFNFTYEEFLDHIPESFSRTHLIDVSDLMFVTSAMYKHWSENKGKVEIVEKNKYISTNNKRAFVAGLVCGKKSKQGVQHA